MSIGIREIGSVMKFSTMKHAYFSIAAMAHAPFIAAARPKFFGLNSFEGLPDLKDLGVKVACPLFRFNRRA